MLQGSQKLMDSESFLLVHQRLISHQVQRGMNYHPGTNHNYSF